MKRFLHYLTFMSVCALMLSACSKDDEPGTNGPNMEGNDPEGTIVLEMNNVSVNGATIGKGLYIDANNNFHCSEGVITSYGAVDGLAYVTTIPTTGWVEELKVTPGNGYVYFNENQYYRLYVVDFRYSLGNAIIGATVKYQPKFCGVDEPIQLAVDQLTFSHTGTVDTPNPDGTGTVDYLLVPFTNENIVTVTPTVEPASAKWLTVSLCTTVSGYSDRSDFLSNALRIYVDPTDQRENSTATIVLKTGYDQITTLAVTRSGRDAFIEFDNGNFNKDGMFEVNNHGGSYRVAVNSNVEFSHISYNKNPSNWCTVELLDNMSVVREQIRKIYGTRADSNGIYGEGVHSYSLSMTVDTNNGASRNVDVALTSSTDMATGTLKVLQTGATIELADSAQSEIYLSRGNQTATVDLKTSIQGDIKVESNASWCTATCLGKTVRIDVEATTGDRVATITFPGFDLKITVNQSKYQVGDEYSENGVVGIVSYMEGKERYVRSESLGYAVWSTEYFDFGSSLSETNGQRNMEIISAIGSWREKYPAFALVADLNVNGVSGWYLPSVGEAVEYLNVRGTAWSSTSEDEYDAYTNSGSSTSKDQYLAVYGLHKFVK